MPTNTTECLCVACSTNITDPDFRVILIQEDYPDIEIGPYCENCLTRIKICSGCQKPVMFDQTTHNGKGDHFCRECAANLDICSHCGNSSSVEIICGVKVCSSCKRDLYFKCPICSEYHHKQHSVEKDSLLGRQRAGIFRKYGHRVCSSCYEEKKQHFKEYKVAECRHCRTLYTKTEDSNDLYCDRCYNEFNVCEECGIKEPNIEGYTIEGTFKFVCRSCVRKYKQCDLCNTMYLGNTHTIKGKTKVYKVCSNCKSAKPCFNCDSLSTDSSGMCRDCITVYKDNICDICGRIKDGNSVCRVCSAREIYSYSLKPRLFFNTIDNDPSTSIFFGFENEVSFGSQLDFMKGAIRRLYEVYDPTQVFAKSDSSINGNGYEIVSQPMTLMYFHKMNLGGMFNPKMQKGRGCGLHIHVSRESFSSDVHLYKVCNFIHSNTKFTEFIAGRAANGYCAPFKDKVSKELKKSKSFDTARHSAVNLTNRTTVEFRLFDGCTTETELRNKVETLHALISYMRSTSIKDSSSIQGFIDFVCKSKKYYPNACSFLGNYNAM